ncbi:MAG: hypothetical protein KatS3mg027_0400 [Bacteroidia bacterium]|nr:MAG: hypothetical protein KatS3mg027_0400 [Bacteroidia bacterium]
MKPIGFFQMYMGFSEVNKQLKRDIEKFKEETDEGKNSIELARKSDSIKEKLSQIKSPHLPPIIFSPFLLGFNISYQANIPLLSQVLQYYQMMNGINLSFYISHRKNYFNIFFGYASSKLMTNYISETNNLLYQKGNIIGFGNYGIGYERSIIDNKRWRLTPFVGIGGSNLNINYYPNSSQTNDRSKDLKINSIYYCGGISFVLLFRKYLYTPGNYQYLFYNVLVYNYGLNLKLYISYSNFNPTFKNFLINFSLGFNLLETRKGKFVDNKNALIID